jgi:hypothetical protein
VRERGARVRKGRYINKLRVGPVEMSRAEIVAGLHSLPCVLIGRTAKIFVCRAPL